MTNGRMTIDKLGLMMAKVIEDMATKDDLKDLEERMDQKLENLEEKLSGKIDNLQRRMDVFAGLDRKVETLDKRLTKVESKVGV